VPPAKQVAIVGGILIDVTNRGHSSNDIADSVVLIEGEKIAAAGPASEIRVPTDFAFLSDAGFNKWTVQRCERRPQTSSEHNT
jgi:hypothetical protein